MHAESGRRMLPARIGDIGQVRSYLLEPAILQAPQDRAAASDGSRDTSGPSPFDRLDSRVGDAVRAHGVDTGMFVTLCSTRLEPPP